MRGQGVFLTAERAQGQRMIRYCSLVTLQLCRDARLLRPLRAGLGSAAAAFLLPALPTNHVPTSLRCCCNRMAPPRTRVTSLSAGLGSTATAALLPAWPTNHVLTSHLSLLQQVGATTYACRIPERWYPGKFDIMGHSHQLWHAAVVLTAWVHYLAIMILLQWRDAAGAGWSES
jgi:hypothetical protein